MSRVALGTDVLVVDGVTKAFGDVVALSDVTFRIGSGVTGILGPNGAGKSTLLRLVCGLIAPDEGTVRLLGEDPRTTLELYRRIGLVPQQEAVFEPLTARIFVRACAQLAGVRGADSAATGALGLVDLDPDDPRPLRTYSKGMRQRVKVAQALVADPDVLVLDEPLDGLDPRQRLRMIELFRRLGGEGRCVLVSSHVLAEVERFGSRILLIADGRVAAEGDFHEIRALMDDRPHRIRVRATDSLALAAALLTRGLASAVRREADGALLIDTDDVIGFGKAIAREAVAAGGELTEVRPLDDDLESVFRYLVVRRR